MGKKSYLEMKNEEHDKICERLKDEMINPKSIIDEMNAMIAKEELKEERKDLIIETVLCAISFVIMTLIVYGIVNHLNEVGSIEPKIEYQEEIKVNNIYEPSKKDTIVVAADGTFVSICKN